MSVVRRGAGWRDAGEPENRLARDRRFEPCSAGDADSGEQRADLLRIPNLVRDEVPLRLRA